MRGNVFIDSNIWLYSFIEDAEGKYRIAAGLIQENKEKIAISLQVEILLIPAKLLQIR